MELVLDSVLSSLSVFLPTMARNLSSNLQVRTIIALCCSLGAFELRRRAQKLRSKRHFNVQSISRLKQTSSLSRPPRLHRRRRALQRRPLNSLYNRKLRLHIPCRQRSRLRYLSPKSGHSSTLIRASEPLDRPSSIQHH